MPDLTGATASIIVDRNWSYINGIRRFLGPADRRVSNPDEGHTIEAKIVDYADQRGLWIELNTDYKQNPSVRLVNLLIPWNRVLSIALILDAECRPERVGIDSFRNLMNGLGYQDEDNQE